MVGVCVLGLLAVLHKELILGAFDDVGAASLGYRTRLLDGVVLVAITVTMVAAIPAVGTLLAIALLTVPALTARLWTDRVGIMMIVAGGIGGLSGSLGLAAAAVWRIAAGGAIALATGVALALSLLTTTLVRSDLSWRRIRTRRPDPGGGAAA